MTRETRAEQARPTRLSLREQREKLSVLGLDTKNFYYRWVKDTEDRIAKFLRAGYEFVQKSEINRIGDPTVDDSQGTDTRAQRGVGGGYKAFLMKLPLDIKAEYDAEKEADLLETERAMRRTTRNSDHKYAQDADFAEVKISNKRGR